MPDTPTFNFQEAEARIAKCKEDMLELREHFLDDGKIDSEEKEILDRIKSKIERVEALFEKKKAQADIAEPMGSISGSVGKGGKNKSEDVKTVQLLLNKTGTSLEVDGLVGPKTNGAISKYQAKNLGFHDGRVDVDGQTWGSLTGTNTASGAQGNETGDTSSSTGHGIADLPASAQEMEDQIAQQVENQIPEEVTVIIVDEDEDDDVLASPEVPFVLNQEISVGCPFGEIKIKFNDRGQIESAAVAKPIIPGVTIGAGAYCVFAKVEAKPYTGELKLSKKSGTLKLELELSVSASGMMGLGVAKGDAWAGIGIDIEVKVARTQTLTAEIAIETLKEIAMSPTPLPGAQLAFNLPVELVLSGQQSLVIGASAPKGAASIADKIVLKDYNPMATLKVSEQNGSLTCECTTHDGLTQMAEDVSRTLVPSINMLFTAIELAEEIARFIDDPDAYLEEKQKKAEAFRQQLIAFPDDFSDFVDGELNKLDKFDKEVSDQLEEWGDDVKETIDEVKDTVDKAVKDIQETVEEKIDDVTDTVDETIDDVKEMAEDAMETVDETIDDIKEGVDNAIDDAEDAFDDAKNKIKDGISSLF